MPDPTNPGNIVHAGERGPLGAPAQPFDWQPIIYTSIVTPPNDPEAEAGE